MFPCSELTPTVSVVVPAYNAMRYLPATIDSALQQTFQDFEIIIVNDGSHDDIEAWVHQLNHPKIRLISQRNQGLSAARNAGIAAARGEFIALLDADDIWSPIKLVEQVKRFEDCPEAGLVYTGLSYIDAQGVETGRMVQGTAEGFIFRELLLHNWIGCGSVPMVRRECFETLGGFDTNLVSFGEDWDMWLRLAAAYPIQVVRQPLVQYRQHPSGASRNWPKMERSFNILLNKAFDAWSRPEKLSQTAPDCSLEPLRRRAFANAYLGLAWKPLQAHNKSALQALNLARKALGHDLMLLTSKEIWRLAIAIILTALFRSHYAAVLKRLQSMRRLRQNLRLFAAR